MSLTAGRCDMNLVLHAPNLHQGGGASLLTALLKTDLHGIQRYLIVDERFVIPELIAPNIVVRVVPATLVGRLQAERYLRRVTSNNDVVLCLGNLPPVRALQGPTVLFLQNRHLVEPLPTRFPLQMRLRILAEKWWLRLCLRNIDTVIVQTPTMWRLVQGALGVTPHIVPFIAGHTSAPEASTPSREAAFDFIYVSSGEPHKNHLALIEAWRILADENIRPRLAVTLSEDRDRGLCLAIVAASKAHRLNITNLGLTSVEKIQERYIGAKAFVFPSLGESFGLPLLEACAAGLPIIAPEADYVRDVVDPVETFDPASPISIARAIKRYLRIPVVRAAPRTPEQFMAYILASGRRERTVGSVVKAGST